MVMDKNIRIMMIKQDITMGKLADKLGVAQSNLSRKFKNNTFTVEDLKNIADALECDLTIEFTPKQKD
jgi:DNA-binding Xre family transcriptional regulator